MSNTLTITSHSMVDSLKPNGQLDRAIGWALIAGLFVAASWFDPLILSERNSADLTTSLKTTATTAQPMIAVMAFLLLVVPHLLTSLEHQLTRRKVISWLTGTGTVSCVVGYLASPWWPTATGLIPGGALMVLIGFTLILCWAPAVWADRNLRIMSLTIGFAMMLVTAMGLFQWDAELFLPAYLGYEDGFRMRMLRLARVAAIALPLLSILYDGIAYQDHPETWLARWGGVAMVFGAIGLPVVLASASLTLVGLKLLLPLPAHAILAGTLCAAWRARKHGDSLELCGWLLIASSMAAGMFMGLYAFLLPPLSLHSLADYNDLTRRLIRLAHIYGVLNGMVMIFVARELRGAAESSWTRRFGVPLLPGATLITVVAILFSAGFRLPPAVLGIGPALAALGIVLSVEPNIFKSSRPPAHTYSFIVGGKS
jgi:hypothetical protein